MKALATYLAPLAALLVCLPASAETLVATRVIRAKTIIAPGDVEILPGETTGALEHPAEAIGLEAVVTLYPDRAIRPGDLAPPALVERNALITLIYRAGGVAIATEGRALDRGAEGDRIRAMNLSSRTTVTGRVDGSGRVVLSPNSDLELALESP
ncbi:flagellar basal body P-ring formation chaperone FlgA [Roseicyclus sp. F158]|uniref:Flagella basal body P-ring formation protein FlgA n=1 Tax=Tropicimonas omnivorans TaxID=3075590 RepID=A0ABU3DEY1_9RHOB|nr:flagellar basal body P-ring formation chaperone FlgA [Roseicyclus sp. F158]MDT0681687.1 flagellar basal body P-ring formation chaperone FlgA [Roseicyclus sp. F158]